MSEPSPADGRGVGGTYPMQCVSFLCPRPPALGHLWVLAEQGDSGVSLPSSCLFSPWSHTCSCSNLGYALQDFSESFPRLSPGQ